MTEKERQEAIKRTKAYIREMKKVKKENKTIQNVVKSSYLF